MDNSQNSFSKPFLLTFNNSSPPPFIEVPGETENLKVYDYKQKPLCTNCLEYTYSKRKCSNSQRCKFCSQTRSDQECTENVLKCLHCEQNHQVRDSRCPVQRQEEEICSIQNREKIPWMLARQKYFMQQPDGNKSNAEVTRNKTVNDQLHTELPENSDKGKDKRVKVHLRRKRNESEESSGFVQTRKTRHMETEGAKDLDSTIEWMVSESDMDAGDTVENIRQEIEKMQEEYEAYNKNSENGPDM